MVNFTNPHNRVIHAGGVMFVPGMPTPVPDDLAKDKAFLAKLESVGIKAEGASKDDKKTTA